MTGKSWSLTAEVFWPLTTDDQLQAQLEPTLVGNELSVSLEPKGPGVGNPIYSGPVVVESQGERRRDRPGVSGSVLSESTAAPETAL